MTCGGYLHNRLCHHHHYNTGGREDFDASDGAFDFSLVPMLPVSFAKAGSVQSETGKACTDSTVLQLAEEPCLHRITDQFHEAKCFPRSLLASQLRWSRSCVKFCCAWTMETFDTFEHDPMRLNMSPLCGSTLSSRRKLLAIG